MYTYSVERLGGGGGLRTNLNRCNEVLKHTQDPIKQDHSSRHQVKQGKKSLICGRYRNSTDLPRMTTPDCDRYRNSTDLSRILTLDYDRYRNSIDLPRIITPDYDRYRNSTDLPRIITLDYNRYRNSTCPKLSDIRPWLVSELDLPKTQ